MRRGAERPASNREKAVMVYEIDTDVPMPKGREVSSIAFPYLDLSDAISVAKSVLDVGGVPLDRDQLAAALGQVPTSGAFNVKLSTARLFGLLESVAGRYQLTPLGFEILDPARERGAKAAAFLNVPLYKRVFDEFKGRQLPPRPAGLEQAFVTFGVAPKQRDRARQAFDRSARLAGFFPTAAEDRLVMPVLGQQPAPEREETRPEQLQPSEAPVRARAEVDPLSRLDGVVAAMIAKLPAAGEPLSPKDRQKWLTMMEMALDMAHPDAVASEM
jgi:hypothetical protein